MPARPGHGVRYGGQGAPSERRSQVGCALIRAEVIISTAIPMTDATVWCYAGNIPYPHKATERPIAAF